MALLMEISKYAAGINIILILSLLFVYAKNFRKIKSLFTVGLAMFAILFLLQNIVSFYFALTMMPYYVAGVELYVSIFTVLQMLAFSVLNYITWR